MEFAHILIHPPATESMLLSPMSAHPGQEMVWLVPMLVYWESHISPLSNSEFTPTSASVLHTIVH